MSCGNGGPGILEHTQSLCPECRRLVDATFFDRDGRVFLKKRCEQHGDFGAHVDGDAAAWVANERYISPGTKPVDYSTSVEHGCPYDCGLCPGRG